MEEEKAQKKLAKLLARIVQVVSWRNLNLYEQMNSLFSPLPVSLGSAMHVQTCIDTRFHTPTHKNVHARECMCQCLSTCCAPVISPCYFNIQQHEINSCPIMLSKRISKKYIKL